jgi:hypothetical protein
VVTEERVFDRRYCLMVPRDEDHTVCSNRSRDKLLLLALRKVEPEFFSPDDLRKRRNRVL